jgi:hypothetical protein
VTARDHVRVASKLADFAAIDDALRRGEVSYSKARAMLRIATPENEPLLLGYAAFMTASQLEVTCRKYALVQRHGQNPDPRDDHYRRYVRRREPARHDSAEPSLMVPAASATTPTQSTSLPTPVLPAPEVTAACSAVVHDASDDVAGPCITPPAHVPASSLLCDSEKVAGGSGSVGAIGDSRAATALAPPRGPSVLREQVDAVKRAFSRADALVAVAQGHLRGDRPDRSPIEITIAIPAASLRAQIVDPVEVGEMGEALLSPDAVRRLSCDAGVVEIIEDEHGTPLSVGRRRRTIAGALKRALRKRDTMCTFPGCTNRLYLEGHHIRHWADGGETSLLNTALLCTMHHKFVHEYGYHIEMGPDQRPRFRDPRGRLVAPVPAPPAVTDLGWPTIEAMNKPLAIDAARNACRWDGRPVDHGALIGHLVSADRLG